MKKTLVALYDDIVVARQVIEDLVNADFERSSISLITNDAHNQYSHYLDKDYVAPDDAVPAGEGAGFGAMVGVLTGILVELAALVIPGIGLALVGGPIVAGLTGALAGAITGGIVAALVKTGVPEDEAPYYAEGIRRGGTMISVETSDTLRAEDIMHRHGSVNIHQRINLWRQEGWQGFDTDGTQTESATPPAPEILPVIASPTPITIVPVVPMVEKEPQLDTGDARLIPAIKVDTAAAVPVIPVADVVVDTVADADVDSDLVAVEPTEPVLVVVTKEPWNRLSTPTPVADVKDTASLTEISEG